ncbi:MAG: PHP domain-containing protein, partial [Clostridia bacterium]|nr:PHP domain-containing protein [Clostridia bacterium]
MNHNKRAELHLHTKTSGMDSVISPEDAVEAAKKMGLYAVAITDHDGVRAFPRAMRASE